MQILKYYLYIFKTCSQTQDFGAQNFGVLFGSFSLKECFSQEGGLHNAVHVFEWWDSGETLCSLLQTSWNMEGSAS